MTEFEEMIVNDDSVSLPTIEDYYYNSLTPDMNTGEISEEELFFSETPPGGEDAIGFSDDGTIFTIHSGSVKDKNSAFILNWSETKKKPVQSTDEAMMGSVPHMMGNVLVEHNDEIFTNILDGDTVRFYENKCNVGDTEQAKKYLDQLVRDPSLMGYKTENDKKAGDKGIGYCKMLFYRAPEIPHYTITYLPKKDVLESAMEFGKIDERNSRSIHATYKPEIVVMKEAIEKDQGYFSGLTWKPDESGERYKIKHKDDDIVYFFHDRQVWDITPKELENDKWGRYLSISRDAKNSDEVPAGYKARDIMYKELSEAVDTRICISTNSLRENNKPYLQGYGRWYFDEDSVDRLDEEFTKFLNGGLFEQDIKYSGYNLYGQEKDKSLLSVIYVKKKVTNKKGEEKLMWVNLNKYIIYKLHGMAKDEGAIIGDSPRELFMSNYAPQSFNPRSYDYDERSYVDSWYNRYENEEHREDRRLSLQKKCFEQAGYGKLSEHELAEWTVSIGDVSFFVPPESIRVVTQTSTERLPLLRAKGTMNKFTEKADKQLELSLFFNEDLGVNGLPMATELWKEKDISGNKIIYYMNGLRALIAEFKFTPFLPIVNNYINDVLRIFSVSLEDLTIATVPGFPRLLQANLILRAMDYAIYMPELPEPFYIENEDDKEDKGKLVNPFSTSINYDLLRYYYQKPLLKGNELAQKLYNEDGSKSKSYNINTKEFLRDTLFSGRSALIPCQFLDSSIDIYIADEDYLKRLYSIKKDAIRNKYRKSVSNTFIPTAVEEDLIRDLGDLYGNDDIHEAIREVYIRYFNLKKAAKQANRAEKKAPGLDAGLDEELNAQFSGKNNGQEGSGDSYSSASKKEEEHILNSNNQFDPKDWNETDVEAARKKAMDYYVQNMRYQVVPLGQAFKREQNIVKNADGENIIQDVEWDVNSGILKVQLNLPYVRNHDAIKNVISQFENEMQFKDSDVFEQTLKDNTLIIDMKRLSWWKYLDAKKDGPVFDLEFLKWCYMDGDAIISANNEALELKEASDWENINSLKFELVGENIRVDKFQARMSNTFAQVSLLESSGYAEQYMGGQDVSITWEIQTKNKDFVTLMQSLPEYEAYCMRQYSLALPSFPIKIDSEFTRLLGVFEVSIENVVVSTVPDQPELFQISVTAASVDRTLRNREALQSIDHPDTDIPKEYTVVLEVPTEEKEQVKDLLAKHGYVTSIDPKAFTKSEVRISTMSEEDFQKISDEMFVSGLKTGIVIVNVYEKRNMDSSPKSGSLDNFGMSQGDVRAQMNIKTYDDISEKLAQAEIYPDLELPTIGELENLGFKFMRYKDKKRQRQDLYVDPDFYFDYPEVLISEAIRSTIQEVFSEKNRGELGSDVATEDYTGASVGFNPDGEVDVEKGNAQYKDQLDEKNKDIGKRAKAMKDFEDNDFAKNYPAFFMGEPEKWNISTKIQASFLEETFLSLRRLKESNFQELQPLKTDSEEVKKEKEAKLEKHKDLSEFYEDKFKDIPKGVEKLDKELRKEISNENRRKWIKMDYLSNILSNHEVPRNTESLETSIRNMLTSVGDTYHGRYEYNSTLKAGDWKADQDKKYAVLLRPDKSKIELSRIYKTIWQELSEEDKTITGQGSIEIYRENEQKNKERIIDFTKDKVILVASQYNIRTYTFSELIKILPKDEAEELTKYDAELRKKEPSTVHRYVLDPYYRLHNEKVKEYMGRCIVEDEFARAAFARNVSWWLNCLYKEQVFPSLTIDVMRNSAVNLSAATQKAIDLVSKMYSDEYGSEIKDIDSDYDAEGKLKDVVNNTHRAQAEKYANDLMSSELLKNLEAFARDDGPSFDAGKVFVAIVLCLYDAPLDGTHPIYSLIKNRDYEGLQNKLHEVCYFNAPDRTNLNNPDIRFRKFVYALCGYEEINNIEFIGRSSGVTPTAQFTVDHNIKIALRAAMDPHQYVLHSFYDMIRSDYRGRMLRAFPTFYCLFMDEGREIGVWKLHDNFYSINAISDIKIVKSRKIPADTCTLLLSNNYATFTTDDEDSYTNYKTATLSEIWTNMFHKDEVAYKEETKRLAADRINRAKLQPGIRIHVRQGYGSDARELGCAFNGTIVQVEPGAQMVNIVAQGDGIELMNPIMTDRDGDEIQYQDLAADAVNNVEGSGATPGKILTSFLTTKGGFANRYTQGQYSKHQWAYQNGRLDNSFLDNIADSVWCTSPYGLYHFGDPDYKDIFPGGEAIQNIYDVSKFPNMDQERLETYKESDLQSEAPFISFESRGKTIWEIMHICKSVAPDWVTGTRDFGMRSTIFFGRPHYYYAYDYIKHNGVYIEKRKPYQQYHVYYSNYDIIDNSITASANNMTTCATGLYQDKHGWITSNEDIGPLWIDQDIYPEYQKSTIVDTRLKMKDAPFWNTSQFTLTRNSGYAWLDFPANIARNTLQSIFGVVGNTVHSLTGWFLEQMDDDYVFNAGKGSSIGWQRNRKIAWSATANALKESVKEMYQGTLQLLGDPSVKPNDRIILKDAYNDLNGQVLVRNVVHSLNAQTGFTTTVEVDAIATVDDPEEMFKQNVITRVVSHVAIANLVHMPILKLARNGVKMTATTIGKMSISSKKVKLLRKMKVADLLSDAAKATRELRNAKKLKTIGTLYQTGKALLGGVKVAKTAYSAGTAATVGAAAAAGAGATIGALGGPVGALVGATIGIISWGVTELVMAKVSDFVNDNIKNRQVLQVFPIQRFGMAYTAGLEGSMGAVYNSITWDKVGPMEEAIADHLAPNSEDSNLVDGLKNIFLDQEIRNNAAKFRRNNKYNAENEIDGNKDEVLLRKAEENLMNKSQFHQKDRANGKALTQRVTISSINKSPLHKKLYTDGVDRFYIENIESLLKNENKKNHCYILAYTGLIPYIKTYPVLHIAHEKIDLNDKKVKQIPVKIGREDVLIKAIKRMEEIKNDAGEVIKLRPAYDIPYLEKDALEVLKTLCSKLVKSLIGSNFGDAVSLENSLAGTSIIVTSAMVVGSNNKLLGSGMTFTIIGTGKFSGDIIKKTLTEMKKNEEDVNFYGVASFSFEEFKHGEFRIMINPPVPFLPADKKEIEEEKKKIEAEEAKLAIPDIEVNWEEKWYKDEKLDELVDIGEKVQWN